MFDAASWSTRTFVGYAGGETDHPTYKTVCAGDGHTEVVLIEYDPSVTTFGHVLDVFWTSGHHYSPGGNQYGSGIWTTTEEQLDEAKMYIKEKQAEDNVKVEALDAFWMAEEYHQHFQRKQSSRH